MIQEASRRERYIFLHLRSLGVGGWGPCFPRLRDNTDGRKPTSNTESVSLSILSGKIQEVLSSSVLEFRRPRKKSKALLLSVWPILSELLISMGLSFFMVVVIVLSVWFQAYRKGHRYMNDSSTTKNQNKDKAVVLLSQQGRLNS